MESLLLKSPHWLKVVLINIYGYILARRRFSGSFKYWYKEYIKNLEKPPDKIREEQFGLLKLNLIYAFENIPYYTRIFKEVGLNPYRIKSVEEIKKIPFLTKEIIRNEFDNLYNKKIKKYTYRIHQTSGSTGEKLKFLVPNELFYKKNMAFLYRFYTMWGIKPKDKRVTLGGRLFTNKAPYWIFNRFENQLLMSTHHLSMDTVESYLTRIEKFNPIFIQGHPSAMLLLAKYLLYNNRLINLTLKAIFTTGETLVKEDQILIEKAFRCSVAQQYGSGENCFSAQQAPNNQGFLINYEHGYVELIGNDELKEVVVSSFQNNVMPFIRYKMNDFVNEVDLSYSKKFNLPILFDEIMGRKDDVIKLKNGDFVLPVTIRMNIKPVLVSGTNYQLIQIDYDRFMLTLIDQCRVLKIDQISSILMKLFGEDIKIDFQFKDTLISSGGKVRNVICQIK